MYLFSKGVPLMSRRLLFKGCALITAIVTFYFALNELLPAYQTRLPTDVFITRNIAGWLFVILGLFCCIALIVMIIADKKLL